MGWSVNTPVDPEALKAAIAELDGFMMPDPGLPLNANQVEALKLVLLELKRLRTNDAPSKIPDGMVIIPADKLTLGDCARFGIDGMVMVPAAKLTFGDCCRFGIDVDLVRKLTTP